MLLWQNIPFFCIMTAILSAAVSSVLPSRIARIWTAVLSGMICAANGLLTAILMQNGGISFTFMMGHFPAPWGNELQIGPLESLSGCVLFAVFHLTVVTGTQSLKRDAEESRHNLYCVTESLLMASLLAMLYTNDIFTGYVFLEIQTIAACALIIIRFKGRTLAAAVRYMILNLLGSGLFLLGIAMLYGITGHLLMWESGETIAAMRAEGLYTVPLTVSTGCIALGMSIKSGLFPFHTWMPDAYSYTTPTSSALLSSLVSKGYIFLLIKLCFRVFGLDMLCETGISNVFFVLGLAGMLMGSIDAIRERDIRRMLSSSSIAQIGYIYLGLGTASTAGLIAALYQMYSHSAAKSMLFMSTDALCEASGNSRGFHELRASAKRSPCAGIAFTIGAFSMTGIPFLGGFIVKLLLGEAAMQAPLWQTMAALLGLAASTALNTVYFLKTVTTIYRHGDDEQPHREPFSMRVGLIIMAAMSIVLGLSGAPLIDIMRQGLAVFGINR